MKRKMKNVKTGRSLTIVEYIMLKDSCFEYYVTSKNHGDGDTVEILAYGNDVEPAIVSLFDIKANIAFRTKNLGSLLPVPGWKWVKNR